MRFDHVKGVSFQYKGSFTENWNWRSIDLMSRSANQLEQLPHQSKIKTLGDGQDTMSRPDVPRHCDTWHTILSRDVSTVGPLRSSWHRCGWMLWLFCSACASLAGFVAIKYAPLWDLTVCIPLGEATLLSNHQQKDLIVHPSIFERRSPTWNPREYLHI